VLALASIERGFDLPEQPCLEGTLSGAVYCRSQIKRNTLQMQERMPTFMVELQCHSQQQT
jgi:hypothetical protein